MKKVAERMAALGTETRLSIYRHLVRAGQRGLNVSDIRDRLDMPSSTLSHHLHKLIRVGLVQQERQGTTLICRADYGVMAATFELFARECCADDADDMADTSCCADIAAYCAPSAQASDQIKSQPNEAAPMPQGK